MRFTIMGSLNRDYVFSVDRLPREGETLLAHKLQTFSGGKGANQAVALSRLGGQVNMIGAVGSDEDGDLLLNKLRDEQIDITAVSKMAGIPTGRAFISLDSEGRNTILVYPGANFELTIDSVKEFRKLISEPQIILMQLETPIEIVTDLAKLAAECDTKVVINPAPGKQLPKSLLNSTYLITPNETELAIISGVQLNSHEDRVYASRLLIKQGVKKVVTTLGAQGALYVDEEQEISVDSYPVKSVDTTAAGDSFTASLAYALSSDKYNQISDALNFATAAAALTVKTKGAQNSLPYSDDVVQVLNSDMSNIL